MKTKYIVLVFILISGISWGQNYAIQVELKGAAAKEIKLAYHFTGNVFVKDSILLDSKGIGIFKGDSLLPQGLYKIFLDEKNHFDFLIGADQQFSLYNDSFSSENLKIPLLWKPKNLSNT